MNELIFYSLCYNIQMRKSNKKDRLQPELTHKIQSKLLISKQTSILSSKILSKIDHMRHEQDLQREYNQKFMTDRKKILSSQKSQKSLSSSKVTHKDPSKQVKAALIPQKLIFQTEDFRQKYYELHQDYIELRRKDVEHSEKAYHLKQSLSNFINSPDSRGTQELSKLLESDKIKQILKKVVEQRRKCDAADSILKQTMRILQVQAWDDIVHNLRSRIQRFRNLDQCTFKILELESINKRVVNDFQERLKEFKLNQEQEWEKERQMLTMNIETLKRANQFNEQQCDSLRKQLENLIFDIKQLINMEQSPRLCSNRMQVKELQRIIHNLKARLQEIQFQTQENMFKLLKSNEEMMKFERNIEHIRGQMQQQISDLQQKNQQNLFQISHLQAQIEQLQERNIYYQQQAKRTDEERQRLLRQQDDQRSLLAATLGLEQSHSAKIILRIKQHLQKIRVLQQQCSELKGILKDKDGLNHDLKAQMVRINKICQQAQQTAKTAAYEKQQYKFLLNNLRDQVSEMKKQHLEQKSRIIKEKDEEIVISNKDILQSHSALNDQYTKIRSSYTQIKIQLEQTSANLTFSKTKNEQSERLLIQKQGVIKRLSSQCERYKQQLRQIENSFRQVVEMQEAASKKAATLQVQHTEMSRLLGSTKQRNTSLQKNNNDLIQQRNGVKTQLSQAHNDIKQLKDYRVKLQAVNVQLRLDTLSKQSEIGKLQEKLKNSQNQAITAKRGNEKLMNQINLVTRKFISFKNQMKRKISLKIKHLLPTIRQMKSQLSTLTLFIKAQHSSTLNAVVAIIDLIKKEINNYQFVCNIYQPNKVETQQSQSQCDIIATDLKQHLMLKMTNILTIVSLLRSEKRQIQEELHSLQLFDMHQQFRHIIEGVDPIKIKQLQGSIEMIKEETLQEQQSDFDIRNTAKIISPQEIFLRDQSEQVNYVLQALLEVDQIPSLPYWQKIEANFLAIRRKLNKKTNLKLDISAIDHRDPSINSPHSSCYQQNDLFRKIVSENDQMFQTNRSDRLPSIEHLRKENQQLKSNQDQLLERLGQSQDQLQQLRGKLVKLQNQTSIIGLEHNFKKVIEYLLAENVDLFLQACRIVMKMLHFSDPQMKDFEGKVQAKRKKKKGNFFTDFFKN